MWLAQVESEGHGLIENALLSAEEQGDEFLLMGLRLREGVDGARFEALSGRPLEPPPDRRPRSPTASSRKARTGASA